MNRIEFNLSTGERKEIELTQEELAAAALAKAAEDEFNSPNNTAERDIKNSFEADKMRRLIFEIEFNKENRIRALERAMLSLDKPDVTKTQYRNGLLGLYKSLP